MTADRGRIISSMRGTMKVEWVRPHEWSDKFALPKTSRFAIPNLKIEPGEIYKRVALSARPLFPIVEIGSRQGMDEMVLVVSTSFFGYEAEDRQTILKAILFEASRTNKTTLSLVSKQSEPEKINGIKEIVDLWNTTKVRDERLQFVLDNLNKI